MNDADDMSLTQLCVCRVAFLDLAIARITNC
jgi:hypothetical protein